MKLVNKVQEDPLDIANIPDDDDKTLALYRDGRTIGIFQFESEGMRACLKRLRPTTIEHLIAMNALFRPGPMKNIPTYMKRMHGEEEVDCMHPLLNDVLASTYGIPVYQEQIMEMARIIAGYSLGEADLLRRAMGKKDKKEMKRQEGVFLKKAEERHKLPKEKASQIFDTMKEFAEYGFPKAHSVAYTLLSYQTAYLKAHYPASFMAAVLVHNQNNLDRMSFFLEECKAMGIEVKGPDINESHMNFSTDASGKHIRFGLAAIKGVGAKAVESIIEERDANGPFKDLDDLFRRLVERGEGKGVQRKTMELLGLVGAFDAIAPYHRRQYVYQEEGERTFIEALIHREVKAYEMKKKSRQMLFSSETLMEGAVTDIFPPECPRYERLEKLKNEKDLLGFYLSSHPLAPFRVAISHYGNTDTRRIHAMAVRSLATIVGTLTAVAHRQNKNGGYFCSLTIEDFQGSLSLLLFGQAYEKHRHLLEEGSILLLRGPVQARYNREEQCELRPNHIEPLKGALAAYKGTLFLRVDMSQVLSETWVERLVTLLKKHTGNTSIKLSLTDGDSPLGRGLAKKYKVRLSLAFLEGLTALGVPYSLKKNGVRAV